MKKSSSSAVGLYTIAISVLFMTGFLLLVVFGANIYRDTVRKQDGNNGTRSLLAYVSSCVKSGDSGSVSIKKDSRLGSVIVIKDGSTGYAKRIYRYKDSLVEDYDTIGSAYHPKDAETIGHTKTFSVKRKNSSLIEVRTDAGRVLLTAGGKAGR